VLRIQFDADVKDESQGFNLSTVNYESLNVSIEINDATRELAKLSNVSELDFTDLSWKPLGLKGRELQLMVEFKEALLLS
jgi:hypothetical protein